MIFKKDSFKRFQGFSGFVKGILVSRKTKLVLGAGDTSSNPEIIEMRVFGFSHEQIESYKFNSNQNNITELLSISFT